MCEEEAPELEYYIRLYQYDIVVYGADVVQAFHTYYATLTLLNLRLALCLAIRPYWIQYCLWTVPTEYL